MREGRDLARQLASLCERTGIRDQGSGIRDQITDADFSARLHMSLLSGLLGRIGKYDEEERDYRGAHGLRFAIHPS